LTPSDVFAHPECPVDTGGAARLTQMLRRVLAHEPLSRILGTREFWGLEFRLSLDTLDPRPETETVVEAVLARVPDRSRPYRFLDLGTGTGCLLLALLSEFPNAIGVGADLAPGAAATARDNAGALGLAGRASFVVANWAAPLGGPIDVVIANPPYIATGAIPDLPPEVREHDPLLALDGGADGLAAYRAIAADLPRLIAPGGYFATEIGAGQVAEINEILERVGLQIEGVAADLAGIPRCVVARPEKRGPARK
jgi:release factor glutamine methyltransferase